MDQLFSTNANISLEKKVDESAFHHRTDPERIDNVYEIKRCASWIQNNAYQKVCLQFPDSLLPDASEVAFRLQNIINAPVFITGDTAYESCCVDYVAAAHIDADAIIHFGPICFSKVESKVPCLYIYEKAKVNMHGVYLLLNAMAFGDQLRKAVIVDTQFIHKIDALNKWVQPEDFLEIMRTDDLKLRDEIAKYFFIGRNDRKLMNIACMIGDADTEIYHIDPENPEDPEEPDEISVERYHFSKAILKRRYFLIEKIKDSKTVGIVIGTLAVKNYLQVIERIKKLCKLNGKKHYIISVGKPTVAKLANFPEIDIYAVIACANSEIYESRDFYKPIVTPYDVELALNPKAQLDRFSYDYNSYLTGDLSDLTEADIPESDVSLLSGNVRSTNMEISSEMEADASSDAVALKDGGTVALNANFGAGFLAERSWKGLEQNLGESEVELATEGRRGIAQGYENEMT